MKKKVTLGRKLSLDKDTVARLGNEQTGDVLGGIGTNNNSCGCQTKYEIPTVNFQESNEDLLLAVDSCCKGSC